MASYYNLISILYPPISILVENTGFYDIFNSFTSVNPVMHPFQCKKHCVVIIIIARNCKTMLQPTNEKRTAMEHSKQKA